MRLYLFFCLEVCNLIVLISFLGNFFDKVEVMKIILFILGMFLFLRRCVLLCGFLKWKVCFGYIVY